MDEDLLAMRALRKSTIPKLVGDDTPLFVAILSDLFPDNDIPAVQHDSIRQLVENELRSMSLQPTSTFCDKVMQIYEMQSVRTGMCIVGESGSGKSTASYVLSLVLKRKRFIVNPKSISVGELFGTFDTLTGDWKDGVFRCAAPCKVRLR